VGVSVNRDGSVERRPLVTVTGASGRVGRLTVPALAGRYRLRLVDLDWDDGVAARSAEGADDVERLTCDLREEDAWRTVVESADVLVHLAANPSPKITVAEAMRDVVTPTAHLAAAARTSSVSKIVFASSIHTMGGYAQEGRQPIQTDWVARPCCPYGAAKVFCENLLGLAAREAGLSVICLRLGLTGADPTDDYWARQWLGPGDYQELIRRAVATPVREGTYFGVSVSDTAYDVSSARTDLGFVPQDRRP
jgi:nucleoside-diphosphate-sugar epimerase